METTESKKVALHTLGCRLNFSETGQIAQGFRDRGYDIVDFGAKADVVFINTCTVTDGADSTCRNLIRKAHRSSPEGTLVVAGCYAQMEADKVKSMQGVDLVLGTQEKYKVFDFLESEDEDIVAIDQTNEFWGAATTPADSHTRAFLKIQDGCNYICSFCIIPFARGRSRAMPVNQALKKANEIVSNGFKEIILTGVNIGEYEANTSEKLLDLLKGLNEIPGLERIRLSSVEPNTLNREMLKFMASSNKFLDHFHIPLQSGCDEILKSMRRKYDTAYYRDVMSMILEYFPNAAVGADLIVGYPGETQQQFQMTYDFVSEMPITHFHVFPYSKRKNTTAARLPEHIQYEVKKFRVKSLMELGKLKKAQFAQRLLDSTQKVLFETRDKNGFYTGYTSHFIKVRVNSKEDLKNQIRSVKFGPEISTLL